MLLTSEDQLDPSELLLTKADQVDRPFDDELILTDADRLVAASPEAQPLLQPQPQSNDGSSGSGQTGRDVKVLDPLDAERGYFARATLSTLRNLSEFMGSIRGRRKAILMFSEGIDYPILDVFDSRDASAVLSDTRDAIAAASKANVNFYTIDPRGLNVMGERFRFKPGSSVTVCGEAEPFNNTAPFVKLRRYKFVCAAIGTAGPSG